ncbi:amidohydrolase family protein [Alloyangia pacifica]|uniref:Predicted metal-dependent hydrolase, TIM-barrel fold n=1 Tax=Alloyangia pacifica TaxID=311180 RepID=A0A1I6VXL4_9RHOB|nr:amidohydrolase [Alloyangia pacifica]SDI19864.1 Predicted metal-dependent hydrolase, TIM-barrel fold [Alloyangia pacifica]SFT18480.1 Predicted metal-dependent hydrolase, TIM-barrel fold [Alloyangia pacifica]
MQEPAILDSHLHLVDRSRLDYPWLSGAPALDRDWLLETYAEEARRIGIGGAIHMEVDVADARLEDETDWIAELAASGIFPIRGAIAACRPESAEFPAFLDRSAARDLVVGFRRVLHVVPDEVSKGELFRQNIRLLSGPDLPFDLCVLARQLPLAIELVDSAPNTRFVLDHCGVPDIEGGQWDTWARNLSEIAKRPNVCAKISGVVAYGGAGWTLDELSRWVTHTAETFGPERICWGGDWPVNTLGGGLSTWVAATRAIFAGCSAEERAALYSGNAARIWKL